jgi:hypothetical protein
MNEQEAVVVLKRKLADTYNGKLPFGFIGYPPFVVVNSPPSGPGVDYLEGLANSLGVTAEPNTSPLSWSDFENAILREDAFTIADPVIPTLARRVAVVPYMTIESCVLITCKGETSATTRDVVKSTQAAVRRFLGARDDQSREMAFLDVGKSVRQVAAITGRNRFLVVDGTYEEDILQFFGAPTISLRSNGHTIITEIAAAHLSDVINGDVGLVVDGPSAANLKKGNSALSENGCLFLPLFGDTSLGRVRAGLALAPWNRELAPAIAQLAKREEGAALQSIPGAVTDESVKASFRTFSNGSVPETSLSIARQLAPSVGEQEIMEMTTKRTFGALGVGLAGTAILSRMLGAEWVAVATLLIVAVAATSAVMFLYEGMWSKRKRVVRWCLFASGLLLFSELLLVLRTIGLTGGAIR